MIDIFTEIQYNMATLYKMQHSYVTHISFSRLWFRFEDSSMRAEKRQALQNVYITLKQLIVHNFINKCIKPY